MGSARYANPPYSRPDSEHRLNARTSLRNRDHDPESPENVILSTRIMAFDSKTPGVGKHSTVRFNSLITTPNQSMQAGRSSPARTDEEAIKVARRSQEEREISEADWPDSQSRDNVARVNIGYRLPLGSAVACKPLPVLPRVH